MSSEQKVYNDDKMPAMVVELCAHLSESRLVGDATNHQYQNVRRCLLDKKVNDGGTVSAGFWVSQTSRSLYGHIG